MDIEDLGCMYYESAANNVIPCYPQDVYVFTKMMTSFSLQDVRDVAKQKGICPYYYARENLVNADVIVFNYQVRINP